MAHFSYKSPTHSFNVVKLLNEGRFGRVNLVQCQSSMRKFVMKEICLQGASEREQRAAFLEATLLATLHHQNIVPYVQTYLQSNGRLFILTGFCAGGDLHNIIYRRNGELFPEGKVIDWLVQICLGLKHLHDHKIVHRDLKTKNIFLSQSGTIKVGDLGIARLLRNKFDLATTMIGTPCYMGPEVFENRPYNEKCDVWALGCCLFELVTLEQAFNAITLSALVQNVLAGKVSMIPEVYSTDLSQLISLMLRREPEDRPPVRELLLNEFIRKHVKNTEQKKSRQKYFVHHGDRKPKERIAMPAYNRIEFSRQDKLNPRDMYDFLNQKKPVDGRSDCTSSVSLNSVVTIPDINGNGDGNDNSQHNRDIFPHSEIDGLADTDGTFPSIVCNSQNSRGSSKEKGPSRNSSKENVNPWSSGSSYWSNNSCIAQCSSNSVRELPNVLPNTSMSAPKTPKNNGEVSLDFLKNLSQAMKQARAEPKRHSGSNFGAQITSKLCLSSPSLPNLRDCCLCTSRQQYFFNDDCDFSSFEVKSSSNFRKMWTRSMTVKSADDLISSSDYNSCLKDKLPLLSARDRENVVLPKASDVLELNGCIPTEDLSPNDVNVDKSLIQQIVFCKKNDCYNNAAARQRRRDKLSQVSFSSMTKSAPASVESFPSI